MEHERILHLLRNPWGHRSDDLDKARHAAADALEKWHRCVTHPASAVEWIAVMQAELSALRAHRDELTEELGSLEDRMQELRARVAELEYVAGLMWDRYEDGEPCYEGMTDDDTGTYTGQAVYFSDEETARILAAIPEERLPGNKEGSREEA